MNDHDPSMPPSKTSSSAPVGAPSDSAPLPVARKIGCTDLSGHKPAAHPMLLAHSSRLTVAVDMPLFLVLAVLGVFMLPDLIAGNVLVSIDPAAGPVAPYDEFAFGRRILIPSISLRALASLLVVWAMLAMRNQPFRSVGLARDRFWGHVGFGILATGACYLMMWTWMMLVYALWPQLLSQAGENANQLLERVPRMRMETMFLVALFVGWAEELLFRGYLLTRLRRLFGSWTLAVVVSALMFTLPHLVDQKPVAMGVVGPLALVFSVTTIWRRSIIPAIVGHTLFDFFQFVGLFYIAGPNRVQ